MRTFDSNELDCSDHNAVMSTFEEYEDRIDAIEVNAQTAVQRAYLCEKPLTEVELGDRTDRDTVDEFAQQMSEWFYTSVREKEAELDGSVVTLYSVYLTRFQGVIEVVRSFVDSGERMPADLRGIMFGYETTDVAGFCREMAHHLVR